MQYLLILMVLGAGAVYGNLLMAQNIEESNQRFIYSQNTQSPEVQSETGEIFKAGDLLKASVLDTANTKEVLIPTEEQIKEAEDLEQVVSSEVIPVSTEVPVVALEIVKTLPAKEMNTWAKGKELMFEFNQDVDLESFFKSLSVQPSIDGKFSGELNYGETKSQIIVKPVPALTAEIEYVFSVSEGVKNFEKTAVLDSAVELKFTVK